MRSYDQALTDIYERAEKQIKLKKIKQQKFRRVAYPCASFCLVMVCALAFLFYKEKAEPDDPGENLIEGTDTDNNLLEGGTTNDVNTTEKLDIEDIPGATLLENPEYVPGSNRSEWGSVSEFIEAAKNDTDSFIGTAENIKTVYINDEKNGVVYYISTFDVRISDPINYNGTSDVVRCISLDKRFYDGSYTDSISRVSGDVISNVSRYPCAYFDNYDLNNRVWDICGEKINPSDYADKGVFVVIFADEEYVYYFTGWVRIEEIRNK